MLNFRLSLIADCKPIAYDKIVFALGSLIRNAVLPAFRRSLPALPVKASGWIIAAAWHPLFYACAWQVPGLLE